MLAFQERGWAVVRALGQLLGGCFVDCLNLRILLLARSLELYKRHSLRHTYCMHMHSIRIMHAQEMEDDDEMYSHVKMEA